MSSNQEGLLQAIDIAEYRPGNERAVSEDLWARLRDIAVRAFSDSLQDTRNPEEVEALLGGDTATYIDSRRDPASLIGSVWHGNMDIHGSRLLVAYDEPDNCRPVGYLLSANNVSGETRLSRSLKRLSVVKNYHWIREVVVDPPYQRRGIGMQLLYDSFAGLTALPWQPGSAYAWPEENPQADSFLRKAGFERGPDEELAGVFGEGSEPVRQARYQAKSAAAVCRHIKEITDGRVH